MGGLQDDDVLVANDVLRICIRHSNTDTFVRGTWITIRGVDVSACPVHAASEFLSIRMDCSNFCHTRMVPASPDFSSILFFAVVWLLW